VLKLESLTQRRKVINRTLLLLFTAYRLRVIEAARENCSYDEDGSRKARIAAFKLPGKNALSRRSISGIPAAPCIDCGFFDGLTLNVPCCTFLCGDFRT
jgi:hypothetical protein